MDKRLIKTRDAIYLAFQQTLQEKPYSKITIEDILQKSKVSRSTFYSHYKTKEELLNSILEHIFDHVFSHTLSEEKTHDFSKSSIFDYTHLITHIFYHLHDEKELISAILSSESKAIFIENIKKHIAPLVALITKEMKDIHPSLPEELQNALTSETFILSLEYWFNHNCTESPETITKYFFEMNN